LEALPTYHSDCVGRTDLLPRKKDVIRNVDKLQRHHHDGHGAMDNRRQRSFRVFQITCNEPSLIHAPIMSAGLKAEALIKDILTLSHPEYAHSPA
jgi:hypothetical protein